MTTTREKEIINHLKYLEELKDFNPLIHQLIFEMYEEHSITSDEFDFFTEPKRYTKLCQNWLSY